MKTKDFNNDHIQDFLRDTIEVLNRFDDNTSFEITAHYVLSDGSFDHEFGTQKATIINLKEVSISLIRDDKHYPLPPSTLRAIISDKSYDVLYVKTLELLEDHFNNGGDLW